jgi:Zn-finger nucleic acid-binding protein
MNCPNCGAAMQLVGGRHYFFCGHCGTFHFPETGDDGVRVLEKDASNAQCGVCRVPMSSAELHAGPTVRYCEKCRGVLLTRAHFAEFVESQRAWAMRPPVIPAPLDRRALERTICCPGCSHDMSTHPYYGPGNVVIDTCEQCDLVWLDFGELDQIVNAPGQDRGRRDQPRTAGGDELDVLTILTGRVARERDEA